MVTKELTIVITSVKHYDVIFTVADLYDVLVAALAEPAFRCLHAWRVIVNNKRCARVSARHVSLDLDVARAAFLLLPDETSMVAWFELFGVRRGADGDHHERDNELFHSGLLSQLGPKKGVNYLFL